MAELTAAEVVDAQPHLIAGILNCSPYEIADWLKYTGSVDLVDGRAQVTGWYKTTLRTDRPFEYQMIVERRPDGSLKVACFALMQEIVEGSAKRCF